MLLGSRTQIDLFRVFGLTRRRYGNVVSTGITALAVAANVICSRATQASVWAPQEMILGLEGEDDLLTSRLTKSLRNDLKHRGLDAGTELTLLELRLTMGCSENDLGCIARGGRTINAQSLIFGELEKDDSIYLLKLSRLDIKSEKIVARREYAIPAAALQGERIKTTSTSIVNEVLGDVDGNRRIVLDNDGNLKRAQILGETSSGSALESGSASSNSRQGRNKAGASASNQHLIEPKLEDGQVLQSERTPEAVSNQYQDRNSKKGRENWPVVGFGISTGIGLLALGAGVGATLLVRKEGPLLRDLLRSAEISLADDDRDPNNNVDPRTSSNLCDAARNPRSSDPSLVTNSVMVDICFRAESLQTIQIATFAVAGAMAVSTAIFSYFWIKRNRRAARNFAGKSLVRDTITDQQFIIGVSPSRGGLYGQIRVQF